MINLLKKGISSVAYPILKDLEKFKDLHQGESCYLFGDGISIKWFDLKKFDDKIAIPVSYIPFHNDFSVLNTKYCFLIEPYWFFPLVKTTIPPIKRIRNYVQERYREMMKTQENIHFFVNLSNYPVLKGGNVSYIFKDLPGSDLVSFFLKHNLNPLHGSLRASILMAAYLGFKKVYLIGYDYTHTPSRTHHWYEKGTGLLNDMPDYNKDFFSLAKEFIEIITVTVDGKSTKLNSITYEELTGAKPEYRENTELISEHYLKALRTWPNYNL